MLFDCSAKLDCTFCKAPSVQKARAYTGWEHRLGTRLLNLNPRPYHLYDLAQVSEPLCAPVSHLRRWYHPPPDKPGPWDLFLDFSLPSPSHSQSLHDSNFTTLMFLPSLFFIPVFDEKWHAFLGVKLHLVPALLQSLLSLPSRSPTTFFFVSIHLQIIWVLYLLQAALLFQSSLTISAFWSVTVIY